MAAISCQTPAQLFDKVLPYWGQSIIMVMHGQVGADPE